MRTLSTLAIGLWGIASIGYLRARLSWLAFISTLLCFGYFIWRAWSSPVEYLARRDLYSALACLVVYVLASSLVTSRVLRGGIIGVVLGLVVVEAMWQPEAVAAIAAPTPQTGSVPRAAD